MMTAAEQKRLDGEDTMREIYDLRVLVVGGGFQYLKMFFDAGMKGAKNIEDADIICFTGGEDVDPAMYGEEPIPETYFNPKRDAVEAGIYADALVAKKPMIGICRGSQFLNVMNGGKLWQDVNNHACRGGHSIVDMRTGEVKHNMTSTHHQQMRPADNAEIIAVAELSTKKVSMSEVISRDEAENDDIEVVWYPDSLSLCFQPHPEFQHGECRNYFLDLVDNYILPAC
jgi:gamma-glutamyl-gamma-aminobutyrate hydrolase PuuD